MKRVSRSSVENFLSSKNIAVLGVSRGGKKFGNSAYNELKKKGYNVFAVNPNADEIDGNKCYKNISDIPVNIDGAFLAVNTSQTDRAVMEIISHGVKNIWIQQGSETKEAIELCKQNGINTVYKECILMFANPVESFHKFHRTIKKIFGGLPK
jgi:predicted CoA-binding protein